jgi:hypothetical protein
MPNFEMMCQIKYFEENVQFWGEFSENYIISGYRGLIEPYFKIRHL